jgi:hypothetical protein
MSKSEVTPICCSEEDVTVVDQSLPCRLSQFLIKYLGIPLSASKLPKSAFQPLVDKMVDTLPSWKGRLMNKSGRLILVQTILSAMPTHTPIYLDLPSWLPLD